MKVEKRQHWSKKPLDSAEVKQMAVRYGLSLLEASILLRRGITEGKDLLFYLEDDLRFLHNPFLFASMEDAVDRLLAAQEEKEQVFVFGDRDVDGVSATVLLVEALHELGLKPEWKVPEGEETYGLSESVIALAVEKECTLLVTVDCGISNAAEIAKARQAGIDVIVLDHHVSPEDLPLAMAILDPKIPEESYPFPYLSATAVVSKLVWALRFAQTPLYNQRLCLLNVRQGEDGLTVEACHLVNLLVKKRLCLVFTSETPRSTAALLAEFLQDQEIYVWDSGQQTALLKQIFGARALISLFDMAPGILQAFPGLKSLTLPEVLAKSRLPRYFPDTEPLDILVSLFISSVHKKFPPLGSEFTSVLDLVGLSTLADMMPLEGENRILVRLGMQSLNKSTRPGLRSLLMKLKLLGHPLSTTEVSWQVTPVLNAAGRLGEPASAIDLFLTGEEEKRKLLADRLEELNQERKALSQTAWTDILPQARQFWEASGERFALVHDARVPKGITGILASRLMNTLGVPALVMTEQRNKTIGSLRTNRGFETRRFLDAFADLFIDYGGHAQAAGFQMLSSNLEEFKSRLSSMLPQFALTDKTDLTLDLDAEIPLNMLTADLIKIVDYFEPYGEGNRPLIFSTKGLRVLDADLVGKSGAQHLKMTLDAGTAKWPAIWWNALEFLPSAKVVSGSIVNIAYQVGRNYFYGQESLQLTILDLEMV
ncbi:MAG: single-stranded-DNA-specific exonuclease RecJ [Spirochaetales bacterium]|nr:single-stranded-DNA-specific exonuclease RecJ [Spirochaetales bacterium]